MKNLIARKNAFREICTEIPLTYRVNHQPHVCVFVEAQENVGRDGLTGAFVASLRKAVILRPDHLPVFHLNRSVLKIRKCLINNKCLVNKTVIQREKYVAVEKN